MLSYALLQSTYFLHFFFAAIFIFISVESLSCIGSVAVGILLFLYLYCDLRLFFTSICIFTRVIKLVLNFILFLIS